MNSTPSHPPGTASEPVTIIGLGKMGTTLARLLLRAGRDVTVWNRSSDKAGPLAREGAKLAPSAAHAVTAGKLIIVCVHDYTASDQILHEPSVARALAGRTLVQLTTASPQEARDAETWAHTQGASYLDGAIQAAPAQMGQADTTILISGNKPVFQQAEATLKLFAGNLTFLGEKISTAAALDLATLSYVYGATLGFFHGAIIAETEGFRVDDYGAIVAKIAPAFGEFLKYEGVVIQSGNFTSTESPLSISTEATARLVDTARASGINEELPEFFSRYFKRAEAAGYGNEEVAAVIKTMRRYPATP
jgi:3-hydroxyisobutyrate dehydrogenase-like beta-hydroxyacid dehydrogenase